MKEQVKNQNLSIFFFLLGWLVFVSLYTMFKLIPGENYSGVLTFVISMIFGIVVLAYVLWLWKYSTGESKRIFSYLALSFCCIFILDVIYHIIFNVLHLSEANISGFLLSSYNIPYLGFLLFQFLAWASVLSKNSVDKKQSGLFLYTPIFIVIISCLFILFLAYEIYDWSGHGVLMNFYTGTDGLLEFGAFIAALLCLATAKHKGTFYLVLSFSAIVVADMIVNFDIFANKFAVNNFIETLWFLGLAFRVYGLMYFKRTETYNTSLQTWTYPLNSIRVQIAFWSFAMGIVVISSFLGMSYLLAPKVFF